jgi:hypothetical protein
MMSMSWVEEMRSAEAYLEDRIEKIMCGDPDKYKTRGLAAFEFVLKDLRNQKGRKDCDDYSPRSHF